MRTNNLPRPEIRVVILRESASLALRKFILTIPSSAGSRVHASGQSLLPGLGKSRVGVHRRPVRSRPLTPNMAENQRQPMQVDPQAQAAAAQQSQGGQPQP